jgi:hypothetical protein
MLWITFVAGRAGGQFVTSSSSPQPIHTRHVVGVEQGHSFQSDGFVNERTNDVVCLPTMPSNSQCEMRLSNALSVTQVVSSIPDESDLIWRADLNGNDPQSVAQRHKTMAEALGTR